MICHTLKSTLFPYTTLFRSGCLAVLLQPVGIDHSWRVVVGMIEDCLVKCLLLRIHWRRLSTRRSISSSVIARVTDDEIDRKSTRLNSSHANISYAVFCLKKK